MEWFSQLIYVIKGRELSTTSPDSLVGKIKQDETDLAITLGFIKGNSQQ